MSASETGASGTRGSETAQLRALLEATPLLRGLEPRALSELCQAAQTRHLPPASQIYRDGDSGETLFIVGAGEVELWRERRGDRARETLRRVAPAEIFGEEVSVLTRRQASAVTSSAATLFEFPVHLFRRAVVRSGKAESAERLERSLKRSAARDLLAAVELVAALDADARGALLDAVSFEAFERGQAIYRAGDRSNALYIVGEGLVQIQAEDDERVRVLGYLSRGDFFGDEELEAATPRVSTAIASGPCTLLTIPSRVVRQIAARDPELLGRLRRVALGLEEGQRRLLDQAARGATQHIFRDVYRLKVARSLLVIDLENCVRCGHCAWACASLYGVSRLVRRGDKVVTQANLNQDFDVFRSPTSELGTVEVSGSPAATRAPKSLMLPNSCQHCENPACMIDCPTGAIGKDVGGEVLIRDELCTGCGACARACPWDNIRMAPRAKDAPRPPGGADDLAQKCDLCRSYESGPACVQVCPTQAIFRVDPSADIGELALLFGQRPTPERSGGARITRFGAGPVLLGASIASASLVLVGITMQLRGHWAPSRGTGYVFGVLAAAAFVGLLGYSLPKRGLLYWMRRKKSVSPSAANSVLGARAAGPRPALARASYLGHLALGFLALGAAFAHAPFPTTLRAQSGSALFGALALATISGGLLALFFSTLPSRLTRIEQKPLLPEDFATQKETLEARLFRGLTGRDELLKAVFTRVLGPYTHRRLGFVALLLSGRDLRAEQRRLRVRIDTLLEGRGGERLQGLDDLCRTAVELRALTAQRWLSALLRAPLPVHLIAVAIASVLMVVHVASSFGGRS